MILRLTRCRRRRFFRRWLVIIIVDICESKSIFYTPTSSRSILGRSSKGTYQKIKISSKKWEMEMFTQLYQTFRIIHVILHIVLYVFFNERLRIIKFLIIKPQSYAWHSPTCWYSHDSFYLYLICMFILWTWIVSIFNIHGWRKVNIKRHRRVDVFKFCQ